MKIVIEQKKSWLISEPKNPKLVIQAIIIITITVIADLYSKFYIFAYLADKPYKMVEVTSFFNLVTVWNRGVSFGMFNNLANGPLILSIVALLISVFIFYLLWLEKNKYIAYGFALIIGGALGNAIDRIMNGAVADFLDFYYNNYHWPAFNLADSFITIGVFLYLLVDLFFNKESKENEKK